jgi:hypothetical protein
MTAIMAQLGLTEMELSIDVAKLIGEKMENTRKSIEEHIRSLRIKLDELKDTMIAGPEVDEELIDSLEKSITNPQLLEQINALKKGSPLISKSGLVQVAALLKYSPDLFMAVGGEQPTIVAKQSLLARRRQFLTMLASAKALRDYEDMKGAPPIPNTCVHVNLLRDIKRIDDAPTQFIRLSAFIRKFQGHRDSNWIDCRECKKHLICIHELIQMQQYLNPKDSNTLQKELNLNFCGPVQGGNYQCRNCGQAISSIDFDRGIEFDDEGRPMSGGVIIDDAGVQQQDIEILLGTVSSVDEEEKVDDLEGDRDLQLIIKEITNRIGIFADKKGYSRMIKNIKPYMMTITSPEYRARIRAEAEKKGRLPEKDREKIIEDRIEEYYSRKIISYAAAAILIEVQTRTPDYIIRYTLPGCNKPGFTGFPIGSDNDKTGIEYLSCAVGSIMKNQYPWNKTGFLKEGNPMKRQQGIAIYIEGGIKELLTNPTVQYNLSEKKKYLKALYGSEGGDGKQTDIIFPGFLPRLQTISAEEAAEEPVIAEVAKHPDQLADLWIRMGHKMAKKTAFAVKGSPFLDTTCCVSSIKQPGIFWSALSDIPRLENRHTKSKIGGTRFMVPFSPRLKKEDLPEANPNIYHRVFLNVCFRGPRIGQPHEPGLTLRCPWCDFVFPSHPRILDYDNEGKSALDGQDVTINYTTFQEVLDASHKNTAIPKYIIPSKVDINNIMELTTVEPAISATWAEDLTELIKNISALPRGELSEIDIALAAGKFSDAINRAEAYVYDNITSSTSKSDVKSGALKGLQFINTTASGEEIREIIKTYLIIPMQRILSGLDSTNHINTIDVLKSTLNLSDAHISEKLKPMMNKNEAVNNTEHIQLFNKAQYSFARAKLLHFVRQVNAVVNAAQYINSTNVPGGEPIFKYIMKYILYIPLSSLLSEYSLPPEKYEVTSGVNAIGNSMQLLTNTVIVTLHNYKDEHIVFSDKELQERLQIRIEKEAMEFVKEFDNKTEEERAIEKTKKKYGLGKWSVGGTKAIYMYDPDRYDAEREEKIRAGIIDVTQEKAEYDISKYDLFGISAGIEDEGDRLGVDSGFEDNF